MDMLIMDKFIQRENLAHFKKLIAEAKDDIRREMLAEEEAKDEGGGKAAS
jgi:hypothetical protein